LQVDFDSFLPSADIISFQFDDADFARSMQMRSSARNLRKVLDLPVPPAVADIGELASDIVVGTDNSVGFFFELGES